MNITIRNSIVSGNVTAPASKSYTHRALILASLGTGTSTITHILESEDTLVTLTALKQLGVAIEKKGSEVKISGVSGRYHLHVPRVTIDVKNSGTSLRLLTGLASLTDGEVTITGTQRLQQRPIRELVEALRKQDIEVHKTDSGIRVRGGNLKGGNVTINAKESSQYVSALLLISPYAQNPVTIGVAGLSSRPYVDITIDLMKQFGASIETKRDTCTVFPEKKYSAKKYVVEGDYSSASYFFAAAALTNSKVTVSGLNQKSVQGDTFFLDLLEKMGCKITRKNDMVTVKGEGLSGIEIDLSRCPDLVPALAVLATQASGKTVIKKIGHLRLKESDRIYTLETELTKMGGRVEGAADSLCIYQSQLKGAVIATHNDHRIAMSLAVAALAARGETIITNAEVVEKSYPTFWKDFRRIGAHISIE